MTMIMIVMTMMMIIITIIIIISYKFVVVYKHHNISIIYFPICVLIPVQMALSAAVSLAEQLRRL